MDAKLIEDARAWVADHNVMMNLPGGTAGPSQSDWTVHDEHAQSIVERLAEQPLEGDDL